MTTKIKATRIYFGDNGRTLCGAHLGATAQATGRDLSGQPIAAVTPQDVREWASMCPDLPPIACEDCGREASIIFTEAD